ncbi:MAG: translocation/assembly module TamB domain-containing protein [Gammaproteobacteria bacterium]
MIKRIIIAVIALIILLIAGTLLFALHSETVLRWSVARVAANYPGQLVIGEVNGTLAGPITLGNVQLHESWFDARIQTLTLDWRLLALFSRHLDITRLELSGVDLALKSGSAHQPFRFVRPQPPHLPVTLTVQKLVLHGLQITAPGLSQPLSVDQASLAAQLDNRSWTLSALQASGAHVQVRGHGDWQFRHGDQVKAQLQWQLSLPQLPPFAGDAQVQGDDQVMQIRGTLRAPFQLQLAAEIRRLFTAPAWNGALNFSGLDPERLRAGWPELLTQGELHLQGNPQATVLTGDINAREPKYGVWQNRVDLRLVGRALEIRTLNLARASTGTRFDLSGQVLYAHGHFEPAVRGEWRALPLPLTGIPWFTLPRGKLDIRTQGQQALLSLDGSLRNGGRFKAEGNVNMSAPHAWKLAASAQKFQMATASFNRGKPLPPMNLEFQGHGDTRITRVDRFLATWLDGRIQAQGRIAHGDGQPWQFTVTARGINPAALYPQFPGTLNFSAQLSGRFAPRAAWSVEVTKLDGQLRNVPVQAAGTISRSANLWQFKNVVVQSGNNHLQLDGQYGKQARLAWTLDAPDLASLWPKVQGSLNSEGRADFSGAAPVLVLTLQGKGLHYREDSLDTLNAQVNLQGTASSSHASFDVAGVQIGKLQIDSAEGQVSGSLSNHNLKLALTSPYGNTQLVGNGTYANRTWQGNLSDITLSLRGAGSWKNSTSWQPRITAAQFSLPQACLVQGAARTCLQAAWQPGRWRADALIAAVPMSDLQALLPEGLDYEGSFGGTLHIQEADGKRSLDLAASLAPGAIHNVIARRHVTLLAYTSGDFNLHSNAQLTTGQLNWALADGGYLKIDSQITHGENLTLSGSIQGELHDFDLIPALIPAVSAVKGKLQLNLALGGTPSDPLFDGNAAFTDGAVSVPRYGLNITDILLDLKGDGRHLTLDGSAHSGNGSVNWTSNATRNSNLWQAQGKLSGADFRVADIPEAQIDVSPALDVRLDNRDIWLDGDVTIPHAKIRPRDLSQTAAVSPDQVIVGANSQPPQEKWRVHTKVRAIMGQDVDFAGFGLSGRIAGSVEAVDEPGHPTTGTGTLQIVDGKVAAYGQKLRIERGRLLFNGGAIDNPALDIRAIRPPAHPVTVAPGATEQKVGVIVRGNLRLPKISLFAEPPLPQSQLLSYLLTGQTGVNQNLSPLIGAPPTTASDVTQLAGGQVLASELGQQIGVQDVSVQNVSLANGTNAPAMFLGKYLSPRLYISYGVGFTQPINTLRIQYTLSARWMLEAETGFASGADLIYSIER